MTEIVLATRNVYHTDQNCKWLDVGKMNANNTGKRIHPTRRVPITRVGNRRLCKVCANAGQPVKRGPLTKRYDEEREAFVQKVSQSILGWLI